VLRRHSASKTRVNALMALLRRTGTNVSPRTFAKNWAPARQRIATRCAASGARDHVGQWTTWL